MRRRRRLDYEKKTTTRKNENKMTRGLKGNAIGANNSAVSLQSPLPSSFFSITFSNRGNWRPIFFLGRSNTRVFYGEVGNSIRNNGQNTYNIVKRKKLC